MPPKSPLSNAERCKRYREKLKEDPLTYEQWRVNKQQYNQRYWQKATVEQREYRRVQNRRRQQERRARLKLQLKHEQQTKHMLVTMVQSQDMAMKQAVSRQKACLWQQKRHASMHPQKKQREKGKQIERYYRQKKELSNPELEIDFSADPEIMPTHRPCTLEDQDWEPPSESDMKLLQARRDRSDKVSKLMGDYLLKGYTMLATTCPICETILLQDRQRNNYCVACSELDSDVGKDDPALNHSAAISMAREIELASAGASGSATSLQSTTATAAAHIASTPQAVSALSGPQPQPNADPNTPATLDTCHTLSMTSIDVQSWPSNPNDLPRQELATGHNVTSIPDTETANPHLDSKSGLQFLSSSPRIALSSVKNDGQQVGLPYESCSSSSTSTCLQQLVEKVQWAGQELANTKSVEYSIQLCQLVKTASEAVVALRSARI